MVTYDLVSLAAVNTSSSVLDGPTVMKLNFWIHATDAHSASYY